MAAGEIVGLLARMNLAAAAAIVLVVALRKAARPRFVARLV
jgi:beta-lactamase regulating signal transducer with metallopeptidase domain